jgi:hypothetical protein
MCPPVICEIRPIVFNAVAQLTRPQRSLPQREAVEVFEARKIHSEFADWLKEKEAARQTNDRILFRTGALEPLIGFLTRRSICTRSMTWLAALTHIAIEILEEKGSPERSQPFAVFPASNCFEARIDRRTRTGGR